MIGNLDLYIFRQVLFALIVTTLGLTALVWLIQSLRFVDLIVNHGLSFGAFLKLTSFLIPSFVATILPITTYIVIHFTYQRMSNDRELTVMQATGLSPVMLARPALAVALLVTIAGFGLSLWGVPSSMRAFKQYQWEIRNRLAAFLLQDGVFTPVSDKLTIYFKSRDENGTLHGIFIDDARSPSEHATIMSERGRLLESASGPSIVLLDGIRQEIDRQSGRLSTLTFRQNTVDLAEASHGDHARPVDMSEMSLGQLLEPNTSVERDRSKWIAEAHKRLTVPLTTLSFAMVGLLSTLGGQFRRHGNVLRPMAAIGAMVTLLALGLAVGSMAARDNNFLILLWLHATLPGLVCFGVLVAPMLGTGAAPAGRVSDHVSAAA